MAAEPPAGQLDPEDQDVEEEGLDPGLVGETPKHFAVQVGRMWRVRWLGCEVVGEGRGAEMGVQLGLPVLFQVVDMLALHLPPEKLCPLLVSVALSFQ